MVEGVGLGALLAIADKVKEWAGYRSKRQAARYSQFIEPIHQSLLGVHQDYLEMFERCIASLNRDEDFSSVVEQFQENRRKNESIRRDALAQVDAYKDTLVEEPYSAYLLEVQGYLAFSGFAGQDFPVSASTRALRILLEAQEERGKSRILGALDLSRDTPPTVKILESLLVLLREKWNKVAKAHAKARAYTAP